MNLGVNAAQAIQAGGSSRGWVDMELKEATLDEDFALAHPPLAPGRHARLSVRESGEGMAPEVMSRISTSGSQEGRAPRPPRRERKSSPPVS